jgi:hypothetical protein
MSIMFEAMKLSKLWYDYHFRPDTALFEDRYYAVDGAHSSYCALLTTYELKMRMRMQREIVRLAQRSRVDNTDPRAVSEIISD